MKASLRIPSKAHRSLLTLVFIGSLALGADKPAAPTREERELKMADDSIRASLAVSRSPKGRYLCAENHLACLGGDKAELGLALIGARSSGSSDCRSG